MVELAGGPRLWSKLRGYESGGTVATQTQVANAQFIVNAAGNVPELEGFVSNSEYAGLWYSKWLSSLALAAGSTLIEYMTFDKSEERYGGVAFTANGLMGSAVIHGRFSTIAGGKQGKYHVEAFRLRHVSHWWFYSNAQIENITPANSVCVPGQVTQLQLVRIESATEYVLRATGDAACIKNQVPEMIDAIIGRLAAN
jgi:hypothetical protein